MLVIPAYDMIIAPDATLYLQTEQTQRNAIRFLPRTAGKSGRNRSKKQFTNL